MKFPTAIGLISRLRRVCSPEPQHSELQHSPPEIQNRRFEISNLYVTSAPSAQNALDIFKGEWSCRVPVSAESGTANVFEEDVRPLWLEKEVGCKGKTVLELGPLEGAHSYSLEKMGAKNIVSVESNSHAYLKCLIVKELLGLQRVSFLYGDFIEYLKETEQTFDICFASGVLYHMKNPAELIELLSRVCREHLLIWTHHFDRDVLEKVPGFERRFTETLAADHKGFKHTLYRTEYLEALDWTGFCGGNTSYCHWMSREDIFRCLEYFGFEPLKVNFDEPLHQNGPALAIIARQKKGEDTL